MNWTAPMSAMMLKGLSEVARVPKADKGFKEAAKMKVAKCISSFVGYDVSITQVHNHIHKWRNRWTRIVYSNGLSGALCDKKMVLLEEQHYLGHTQCYNYMELCFANKHATGNYAMATSVPLGTHILVEDKDKPNVMEGQGTIHEVLQHLPRANFRLPNASATHDPSPTSNKKRKRAYSLTEEDLLQLLSTTLAMLKTHPNLCKVVMDLTVFDQNEPLLVLDYLTEHKAKDLNFVKMDDEVRQASFKRILKANLDLL
ncbi:hypothetical protein ZWY2020_006952 [Hordeum vulgare]|nr:hypothetical protein ZWY2020_006952 [Hordeum vulgare]